MQVNLFALFLGNITGTASVYLREIITTPSFFFWKQTDSCSSFTVSVCWSMVTTHPEYTLRTTLIFAFSPRLTSSSRRSREIIYSPMVAEPQEYKYNADAFAARKTSEAKQETAGKELPKVREDKAR